MPHIDTRSGEVVIRIVYDGAPEAGKTTNIAKLGTLMSLQRVGAAKKPGTTGDRTEFFDWLDFSGGYLDGRRVRCQLVSVPGQSRLLHRRRYLLEKADAIVFVADSRRDTFDDARDNFSTTARMVQRIAGEIPIGVILQANKQDLEGALPPSEVAKQLGTSALMPVIGSIAARGDGVMQTFILAVRLATERVRTLLLGDDIAGLEQHADTPEALFAAMLALEKALVEQTGAIPPGSATAVDPDPPTIEITTIDDSADELDEDDVLDDGDMLVEADAAVASAASRAIAAISPATSVPASAAGAATTAAGVAGATVEPGVRPPRVAGLASSIEVAARQAAEAASRLAVAAAPPSSVEAAPRDGAVATDSVARDADTTTVRRAVEAARLPAPSRSPITPQDHAEAMRFVAERAQAARRDAAARREAARRDHEAALEAAWDVVIVDEFLEPTRIEVPREQAALEQAAHEQAAREEVAREQAAREKATAEQVAREQAAHERAAREQVAREQAAREEVAREQAAREQAARERAAHEQAAREKAAAEQAAREQAARGQAAREQAAREKAAAEQAAREQAVREKAAAEQAAREKAAAEQASREQAAREHAREKAAAEQAAREQAAREQAAREKATAEQAAREQAAGEQTSRDKAAVEQAAREQAARESAREKAAAEQAAREQAARESAREQAAREQAAAEQAAREQAEQAAREQAARAFRLRHNSRTPSTVPELPNAAEIASGHVWPPVKGRASIAVATSGRVSISETVQPWAPADAFELVSDSGWLLHSTDRWLYESEAVARHRLLGYVRGQISRGGGIPEGRTLAVAKDGQGWRLWLVTPNIQLLSQRFIAVLDAGDLAVTSVSMKEILAAMRELRELGLVGKQIAAGISGLAVHERKLAVLPLDEGEDAPHIDTREPFAQLVEVIGANAPMHAALRRWFEDEGRTAIERASAP